MAVRLDSSTDYRYRSANVPSETAFTMLAWFNPRVDRNTYSCLFSIEGASGTNRYSMIDADSDGTSLLVYNGDGSADSFASLATMVVGTPFCAALTGNGTGAGTLVGYYRTASQNVWTTASTTNRSFTETRLVLGSNVFDEWFNGDVWGFKVWDRALTPAELLIESYYARPMFPASLNLWWPWPNANDTNDYSGNARNPTSAGGAIATAEGPHGLWIPKKRIFIPAPTSGLTVNATTATISLTTQAATVAKARSVNAATAALTLTTQAATVAKARGVNAATAALTLTAQAATVAKARGVNAATAALTLTTYPASIVGGGRVVNAALAVLTMTAYPATVARARGVNAATAALTLTTYPASIVAGGRAVNAAVATITLTTHSAVIVTGRTVAATAASLSLETFPASINGQSVARAVTGAPSWRFLRVPEQRKPAIATETRAPVTVAEEKTRRVFPRVTVKESVNGRARQALEVGSIKSEMKSELRAVLRSVLARIR